MSVLSAFTSAVLPIFALAGVGYAFGRTTGIDVEPLNAVALYLFVPALAFSGIVTASLSGGTLLALAGGVVAYALVMLVVGYTVGRVTGTEGVLLSALVLAAAFPNAGFLGIPLSSFAFGDVGKTTATVYLTVQNLLVYTLGVYVASSGSDDAMAAVREVFKLPLLYAVAAAVVLRVIGVTPNPSGPFMSTITTAGNASVPLMLVVLGIQLADVTPAALKKTLVPSVLKLGVAPVVAVGIAFLFGFGDLTVARTYVVECTTPAALIPLVLVIAYSDDDRIDGVTAPEYMSSVILVTTVASAVVLTLLIAVLRSGTIL